MEPKKESKKAAWDVKVKLIKLEGGTAAYIDAAVWSCSLKKHDHKSLPPEWGKVLSAAKRMRGKYSNLYMLENAANQKASP